MGVSGAGKTRVGRALASELQWPFLDADDFHPDSNIAKMRRGTPLEPADREAWLQTIRAALASVEGSSAVLACSALRRDFRDALRKDVSDLRFVYLKADRELIRARVAARTNHFMPVSLVDSQFETLDEPADALILDASRPPEVIVQQITRGFGLR